MLLAAVVHVWHYWMAVALAIPAIGLVIAIIVGYLKTVEGPRFPKNH